jgi:hypothetical protein
MKIYTPRARRAAQPVNAKAMILAVALHSTLQSPNSSAKD